MSNTIDESLGGIVVGREVQEDQVYISNGAIDVLTERTRQIVEERYVFDYDDTLTGGELAIAAGCYAVHHTGWLGMVPDGSQRPEAWQFASDLWKPKGYRQDLVRAAALILAELDRIDRASIRAEYEAALEARAAAGVMDQHLEVKNAG